MFVVVVQSLSLFAALWPHGLEHTRLPHPSLSPGVCSNSCLLSKWCHPTISSSVAPFASCPQSFPLSGSFPKSWLFEAKKKKPESTRWSPGIGAGHCPLLGGWEPAKDSAPELGGLQSSWDTRQEQQATTGHFNLAPPPAVLCEHHWDDLLVRAHLSLG